MRKFHKRIEVLEEKARHPSTMDVIKVWMDAHNKGIQPPPLIEALIKNEPGYKEVEYTHLWVHDLQRHTFEVRPIDAPDTPIEEFIYEWDV